MNRIEGEDVLRITVEARHKKTLLAALREHAPGTHRQGVRPLRGDNGYYTAVLFVPASVAERLAIDPALRLIESSNITAGLRRGPVSAEEAGLELSTAAVGPLGVHSKAAPPQLH